MSDLPENIFEVILQASNEKNDYFNFIYDIENQLISESNNRIILGDFSDKICRFCGRNKNDTTFKKKAHVMPEFMGNKRFFSNFECDECNEHFSLYETSLSNYGGILNTFARVKGKKGYTSEFNHGILSKKKYQPIVIKAWNAMVNDAVHPNGFLGHVQGTGKQPSDSQPTSFDRVPNFEDYGLGCLLLAGSEVYRMKN